MSLPLEKSRILITGVQGQVGFELVKSLSATGAELILAARSSQAIANFAYPTIDLDLTKIDKVREAVLEIRPNIIINPAAYTAVDKAEEDQSTAVLVNEQAVSAMADSLKELGGAMIHFSTDYVYNPAHEHPNSETSATDPANVYAASKLAGERALQASDIPHLILRTSWVYGINGNNFVKTMLRLGRERENLRIVEDQIGSPTSATTLSQVVAGILYQGAENPVDFIKSKRGIYNVSDNGYTSWLSFAEEIFRQARLHGVELKVQDIEGIKTSEYKTPALRPLNSRMSMEKIADEFGLVTPKWQQALALFMQQISLKII